MADFLGSFNTSTPRHHVRFGFTTHAQTGAAVAPSSAFEAADLLIYRAADGAAFSDTQRSSTSGITMTSPFDSITGLHVVDIDLSDNTDAGFFATGYTYMVALSPDETVDSLAVVKVLAYFEIGPPPVNLVEWRGTTPNTLSSNNVQAVASLVTTESRILQTGTATAGGATTITLPSAIGADDLPIGCIIKITSGTGAFQCRTITDYVNSTQVVTVDRAWVTNPDNTSVYTIFYADSPVANVTAIKAKTDPLTFTVANRVDATSTLGTGESTIIPNGTGTATAGAATTITLQTALGADDRAIGCLIRLTGGTGSGQCRSITDYVNSTQVATVDRPWVTNPDNTTTYAVVYDNSAVETVCKIGAAFTSTAGTEIRCSAWLERNGQIVTTYAASASCTVTFRENGEASDLISVTDSAVNAQGIFEVTHSLPAFTSDRLYIASAAITEGGNVFTTRYPVPVR